MVGFALVVLAALSFCSSTECSVLLSEQLRTHLTEFSGNREYMQGFPFEKYQIYTVPRQGKFYIDTTCDCIKGVLARGEPWESEIDGVIAQYTKSRTVALDIGAHIGTHTLGLSRAVGADGVVIAFEPNPKIYRELCMNLTLNGCTNVIPVQCALGDHDGQIGILTNIYQNEGSSYVGAGNQIVELRKLDDFGIRNISFIKMDVENYEDMVLIGGRETISASRPIIFLEIQGNVEQRAAFGGDGKIKTAATISLLKKMGYDAARFDGVDYLATPVGHSGS